MVNRNAALRQRFAKNLRAAMQAKGISQSDLARAVYGEERTDKNGYSQPVGKDRISAYVNSKVLPNDETLAKIAEALNTTPEALLGATPINDTPSGGLLQMMLAELRAIRALLEGPTR